MLFLPKEKEKLHHMINLLYYLPLHGGDQIRDKNHLNGGGYFSSQFQRVLSGLLGPMHLHKA